MTVGLPDAAVRESRERIKSAIKNCGLDFPLQNITVNLAPADVKKEGSGFDLPIALGILGTTGALLKTELKDILFLGELSLDGGLRPIKGAFPLPPWRGRKGSASWCCRWKMPQRPPWCRTWKSTACARCRKRWT